MTPCPLHPDVTQPCHVCGVARVRAALHDAPRPPQPAPTKPDPVHDLAVTRARADREANR
jgi:hypothetical protein